MLQKSLLFLAYFFIWANCLAQGPGSVPASLSFQNFTTEDGLSDNNINHIYQDSRGFLWISTPEGLNRFDGTSFKKFYAGKDPGHSLPSNLVNSVIEYKRNYLLVATLNGIRIMNTVNQQFFIPADSVLAAFHSYDFFPDTNGRFWITQADRLLLIDSSLVIQRNLRLDQQKISSVNYVHRLKNGKLVLSTPQGYFYADEENNSFTPLSDEIPEAGVINENLFSYYDETSNSLFTANWLKCLYRINLDDHRVENFRPIAGCKTCLLTPIVYAVKRNTRGQLWVSSYAGLALFDEKNNRFFTYSNRPGEKASLVNNEIACLFEDREKNLWVGTHGGLSKLSNSALALDYYKKELEIGGKTNEIFDLARGADGNIYIATYGNGVFSLNPLSREIKNYGRSLIPMAWSVNNDGDNIIVTGHQQKMYRLHLSTGKTEPLEFLKPYQDAGDLILFAFTDSRGGKWYSINYQQGLLHIRPGETGLTRYSNTQVPAPFPHNYFIMAVEDKKGRLWFGMNKRAELVSFDYRNEGFTVDTLNTKNQIYLQGLSCLLADENVIWVGTFGTGLIRFEPDTGSVQIFTVEDGLSGDRISSLARDNKGRLWVGTAKGLNCLIPGKHRFISFTQSEGLPEINFNDGAIFYDSSDNRLYAGAKEMLICLDPDEFLKSITQAKPLLIDDVLVNNKKVNFSDLVVLKLPYDQNNLQFGFTSIDFENSGGTSYAYKLEGADKDWIESGRQRSASYSSLPAGTYRFLVKATKTGNTSEVITALGFTIRITPPWWRTWWFRSIAGLLIIGLLITAIRFYYQRKLEKQKLILEKQQAIEKERTRIATDMHDDLGAGLSRIKFLSETIGIKKQQELPIEEDISKIREYSHEMIDKMGEIVWALNERNDSLSDLLSYTRSYAVEYLTQSGIICKIEGPDNFPTIFVSGEFRRNIYLVLKEALHNIVKHAQASHVNISIRFNHQLTITVQDDGIGFDKSKIRPFSNGLSNMEKRMKDIGGTLRIINNKGTMIELIVPLK